jgi:hypothetical protein
MNKVIMDDLDDIDYDKFVVPILVIICILIVCFYYYLQKKSYITEDDLVDWIHKSDNLLHTRKVSNIDSYMQFINKKDLIVCLTGYHYVIDDFFKHKLQYFKYPITLITLESDIIPIKEYIDHPLIKHWFSWNIDSPHPKLTCLPIGLNKDRQSYSLDTYQNNNSKEKTKLLCVSQSNNTNSIRGVLSNKAKAEWSHFCDVLPFVKHKEVYNIKSYTDGSLKVDVSDPDYYGHIDEYKFILSPKGAGDDCHRTWEALYLGVIPIVMKSSISELYEDLPILEINDWNDISKEFLEEQYSIIMNKKNNNEYNMDKLYLTYWTDKIHNKNI